MKGFREKTIAFVKKIPKGRVASYGQVAAAIGYPLAARQVGGVLRSVPPDMDIPWWRIVNRDGYLSIRNNWAADKDLQRKLLLKDGVKVSKEYRLDMEKYRV